METEAVLIMFVFGFFGVVDEVGRNNFRISLCSPTMKFYKYNFDFMTQRKTLIRKQPNQVISQY